MEDSEKNNEQREQVLKAIEVCRKHSTQSEELEYVVELLLDAVDAAIDQNTAKSCIKETLESVDVLEINDLEVTSSTLADIFYPSEELVEPSEKNKKLQKIYDQYATGKKCLVHLEIDDDWHPGIIHSLTISSRDEKPSLSSLEVEALEFDHIVQVSPKDIILEEDVAEEHFGPDDSQDGLCAMCERPVRLTAHHLIPRQTHDRYLKKGVSKEVLNMCIWICRPCHSKIHSVEDNNTLAREYNTLDKIMEHADIQRWVKYARKQKARIKPLKRTTWTVGR